MEGARLVEERREEEKREGCGTVLDALRRYEQLAHRRRKKNEQENK